MYFGLFDTFKPKDSFIGSFFLAWPVTIFAGIASHPIDTIRRRMIISAERKKYKSSIHAFTEIVKREGIKSLFKGAGANVLRAVAGAGTLACYDKLQRVFSRTRCR